jgi:ABC-type nickel/cobalt efflux system permease component RcnA
MNKTLSIRLKAALLLIIFSMNIILGFACVVGVDMGFNTTHHHEEEAPEVHVHSDGKKHHHEEAEHKHSHEDSKDDCCNDKVLKLANADKAIPQSAKLLSLVSFTAFFTAYFNINISYLSQATTSNKYFVRGHHPPIFDIRIAIQSFQI